MKSLTGETHTFIDNRSDSDSYLLSKVWGQLRIYCMSKLAGVDKLSPQTFRYSGDRSRLHLDKDPIKSVVAFIVIYFG